MNNFKRFCAWIAAVGTAVSALAMPAAAADTPATQPKDFRAVWVSTINHLDYPNQTTTDPEELMAQADAILDNCADLGMNAVILQVRPCGDALYPSEIYPWSQHLTGAQGVAPEDGFDPLEYWVEEAHERGLELHAWINPYRVTRSGSADYNSLSSSNPALLHPDWVVKHTDGNYYLNPGLPEVRQLVVDGAAEIVENYDVDGIHMDDYFYPGTSFDDADTYAEYGKGFSSIGDWRRHNVDLLIEELDTVLHELDPDISFGVSPFGIWANASSMAGGSNTNGNQTYFSHYADTRKWVKEGWLDYICPQIYWEIGHSLADYETLAYWWADVVKGTGVELYIGMADYKSDNSSPSSPWHGIQAIQDQTALNAAIPEITGEVHFRYKFLLSVPGLADFYRTAYAAQPAPSEPEPETPAGPEPSEEPETPGLSITSRYFSRDAQGEWIQYADGHWNFLVNGQAAADWLKIDGTWYFFGQDGAMQTGWVLYNGTWYYLQNWGGMKTGWLLESGTWYYLLDWGGMVNTWVQVDGTWYWMNPSGAMKADGWEQIDGSWYYFYPSGAMAANTTTPDGYQVGPSGARIA